MDQVDESSYNLIVLIIMAIAMFVVLKLPKKK